MHESMYLTPNGVFKRKLSFAYGFYGVYLRDTTPYQVHSGHNNRNELKCHPCLNIYSAPNSRCGILKFP